MSRRDKLAGIFTEATRELAAANFGDKSAGERVLAGPVRSMGLALDRMDQEARDLQATLNSGERVVELDPDLIDVSFVRDRIEGHLTLEDDLVKSIDESGQEIPILVRPHPTLDGRFQVAYGHRRLHAARLLKLDVRAIVRPLTDIELVVAQGLENTARKDLSYIERAIFAVNLEASDFDRVVIMQALSTDKTELSKLLSVARGVPDALVKAIGPAPAMGRRRWMEFSARVSDERALKIALKAIQRPEFEVLNSDERFMSLLTEVSTKPPKSGVLRAEWRPKDGQAAAKITDRGKVYTLSLKTTVAEGFGGYLTGRLDELYADWKKEGTLRQE